MMIAGNENAGVTVRKTELLEKLKKNLSEHRGIFEEAQKGYREAVIAELDKMLAEARSGKRIRRKVELVEPQDHTKEYTLAISMIEMCTKDEIFITAGEFQMYVMDDWGWKEQFITQTSNYSNR